MQHLSFFFFYHAAIGLVVVAATTATHWTMTNQSDSIVSVLLFLHKTLQNYNHSGPHISIYSKNF